MGLWGLLLPSALHFNIYEHVKYIIKIVVKTELSRVLELTLTSIDSTLRTIVQKVSRLNALFSCVKSRSVQIGQFSGFAGRVRESRKVCTRHCAGASARMATQVRMV